ncbi:hypothetical protein EDB85DRAFT_1901599 [Lactarius pseudohatsudake]|nr:hypothetical protein EDB85DRAFT_1901599 [Lactarius pseudohatsudake]
MTIPLDPLSRQALPLHHRSLLASPATMLSLARGDISTGHPLSRCQRDTWDLSPDTLLDRDALILRSHSRVLRFYNLPPLPSVFLYNLFLNAAQEFNHDRPTLRLPRLFSLFPFPNPSGHVEPNIQAPVFATVFGRSSAPMKSHNLVNRNWVVMFAPPPAGFPTHSRSPFVHLHRVTHGNSGQWTPLDSRRRHCWVSFVTSLHAVAASHFPGLSSSGFTLSSNPPNPRTVFRLGDWMCPSTNCAAHNFGRNLSCIGCGCPRPSTTHAPSSRTHYLPIANPTQVPSPRFVAALEPQMPVSPSQRVPHILTPSGRAFSVGGRVQDVSSDPLSPCISFWPDNEPFPEQSQIRPSTLVGIPHPPILNTGNRGPIEHQPGDWVCRKCNYPTSTGADGRSARLVTPMLRETGTPFLRQFRLTVLSDYGKLFV